MTKSFKEQEHEKLVRAIVDEIYGSVSEASTGNYWINERWNIFCEKGCCLSGGEVVERYYAVSLEQYDCKGDLIDCQADYQDTKDMKKSELEKAIRQIVDRNEERIMI